MRAKITAPVVLTVLAIVASVAIVGGVGLLAGLPWALITGGALGLVGVGVLYDPGNDSS